MKACGITDVGLQRHENQDTFAVERGAADEVISRPQQERTRAFLGRLEGRNGA